jgi:hypothetical protein
MAAPIIDWCHLWQAEFAARFDQPVVLDARQSIPRELIIPLYVWMRQDPAWTASRTALRMGLDEMTQSAVDTLIARKYPTYVLPQWGTAEGGGWT